MADNSDDQTTKLPPLENWAAQTFAYGFLLDRSGSFDYSGNAAPNQNSKSGFYKPQPDDIHLLNLNPQSISVDEPIATEVAFSQGGGKFIESRGGIIKGVSIRGTVGLLPPIAPYALHMQGPLLGSFGVANPADVSVALQQREKQNGFYEFYRLRRLFRQFQLERRQGKNIQMHYLDFKADEFWMIEPRRFRLDRTRFSFNYDIGFDCLEPSQKQIIAKNQGSDSNRLGIAQRDVGADVLRQLRNPLSAVNDSVISKALTRISQLTASAKDFLNKYVAGGLTLLVQKIISSAATIQSFFSDVAAARRSILDVPLNLYKQLYSALLGLEDSFDDVTPDAFKADINEFLLEMRFLTEGLISYHLATYGSVPGQSMADENVKYVQPRATQGTRNNFFQEPSTNSGSLAVNPFVGASGLGLTGDIEKMISVTALRPENVLTGESIFDVAQRVLGDAQRFTELIVFNRLKSPFIVADASNKLPGTIAWSESIFVPATQDSQSLNSAIPIGAPITTYSSSIITTLVALNQVFGNNDDVIHPWRSGMWVGFTLVFTTGPLVGQDRIIVDNDSTILTVNRNYTVAPGMGDAFEIRFDLFSSRRKVTPETVAFGRDMMAVFQSNGLIDVMLGPRQQTQTIEGIENLEQAIEICLLTERGSNKSNPEYGCASIIGRPFEPNATAMGIFYIRQALIADPRISSVERSRIQLQGTTVTINIFVRPVRVQKTLFFRIAA